MLNRISNQTQTQANFKSRYFMNSIQTPADKMNLDDAVETAKTDFFQNTQPRWDEQDKGYRIVVPDACDGVFEQAFDDFNIYYHKH